MQTQASDSQTPAPKNSITINGIQVKVRDMFKGSEQKVLVNGTKFTVLQSRRVETDRQIRPCWLSDTTIVYVSGKTLMRYDFVTGSSHKIQRNCAQEQIVFLTTYKRCKSDSIRLAYVTCVDKFYYKLVVWTDHYESIQYTFSNINICEKIENVAVINSGKVCDYIMKDVVVTSKIDEVTILTVVDLYQKDVIMTCQLGKGGKCEAFESVQPNSLILHRNGEMEQTRYSKSGIKAAVRTFFSLDDPENTSIYQINKKTMLIRTKNALELLYFNESKFNRTPITSSSKIISYIDYNDDCLAVCFQKQPMVSLTRFDNQTSSIMNLSQWFREIHGFVISPRATRVIFYGLNQDSKPQLCISQVQLYISRDTHYRQPLTECLLTYKGSIMDIMQAATKSNIYVYKNGYLHTGNNQNPTQIQNMICMDIHPTGMFMIAGFEFSFRVLGVLQYGVSVMHTEPISKIVQIMFTPFGEMFIVLSKSELRVYRFYNLKVAFVCELNAKNCEFTKFEIDTKGTQAVAIDSSNCMHFIDLLHLRKRRTYRFESNTSFLGYDFIYDMVILTDPDHNIKVVRSLNALQTSTAYIDLSHITCINLCQELGILFIGTGCGAVRSHIWPFVTPSEFISNYTETKLFSSEVTKMKLSMDRSLLYVCSADGNLCTLGVKYYEDGILLCDQMKVQKIKTKGIGFSKYYLDGLSLNVFPEQKEIERAIEDAIEEREVKMVTQEEIARITEQSKKGFYDKQKYMRENFNKKVQHIQNQKVSKTNKRKARIAELTTEGKFYKQQCSVKLAEFYESISALMKKRQILESQFEYFKNVYQEQVSDLKKQIKQIHQTEQELTKAKMTDKQSLFKVNTFQQDKHHQGDQIFFNETLQEQYKMIQQKIETQIKTHKQKGKELQTYQRCLKEQLHLSRNRISQKQTIIKTLVQETKLLQIELNNKKQTLRQMNEQLQVLQATVIERYENIKGSFDNDREFQRGQQFVSDADKLINSEVGELNKQHEKIQEIKQNVKKCLEKQAKDKVSYTKNIAYLKAKRDQLRILLKEKQHIAYVKKCHQRIKTQTQSLKIQVVQSSETLKTQSQCNKRRSLSKQTPKSSHNASHKNFIKVYRNNFQMNRIKDLAKKTVKRIAAHCKQNEQLINEANSLHSEFKQNSKVIKQFVNLKRKEMEKCTSLHHLQLQTTPKLTPFLKYRQQCQTKKLRRRRQYFLTEIEERQLATSIQKYN